MLTEINVITQQFFQKDSLEKVSADELSAFLHQYPYSSSVRCLMALKSRDAADLSKAALYINNPIWLDWIISESEMEMVANQQSIGSPSEAIAQQDTPTADTGTGSILAFEPYHTVDYFASQGIRLQQAELGKDKLGQQLKSFTEWLRSMKKLPKTEEAAGVPDEAGQQRVIINAEASIREKEIVTETMAEVWIKQGHPEKAVDIYQKLSLQDPSKKAYFAAKIDQIKP